MYTRWTQHLSTEEEKESFRKEIYSAKRVLERLKAIIEDDENGLDRSEMHPETYAKPNWDYHQAHKNGIRQYMYQLKTLIDLDQQKGSINDDRS
jgi:hypothetical protein